MHLREEDNNICTAMSDDEEDEEWNKIAPGMDVNMRGPTVSIHDGMEWVHTEDYRRVKRKLNECVKQRVWDEESVNELNAQVSKLRARLKFSTAKKGAALYVKGASISHQRITSTRPTSQNPFPYLEAAFRISIVDSSTAEKGASAE